MRVLTRYLLWQTFTGILGAAVIVIAVILLIDFVETSRDIATRVDISPADTALFSLLKLPLLIQDTLPFIILFGVLWTFFRLNRRSELIVMRASGVSVWRIMAPAVALALAVGLAGSVLLNPLGAATNAHFEARRSALFENRPVEEVSGARVWLREVSDDQVVIIAARGIDDARLVDPVFRFYSLQGANDDRPVLEQQIEAGQARLSGGFWQLNDAVEYRPETGAASLGDVSLPTRTGPEALFERTRSTQGVSFWRLPEVIVSAREAGLSTRAYEIRWQSLLAQPLLLAAAALMAIAATLRLSRLGGAAGFALAGGLGGFLLYFLQRMLSGLGSAGNLDTVSAAWSAPALFALAALLYIAVTEDG
ncbi:MAG: lipopolysaccharide export system permease component LptG [Oceanicaulis sp. HLUCCA04]|nr:MAG: lipopolysaccharide export system permease component LptG [Oceanicaulis sp. HLUCCA04]